MVLVIKWCAIILSVFAMVSCGSEGGGETNSSNNNGTQNRASFTILSNSIEIEAYKHQSQRVEDQLIIGTVTGVSSDLYIFVDYTQRDTILHIEPTITSSTRGELRLILEQPNRLEAGIYRDTITVRACSDEDCITELTGSPQTVDFVYEVKNLPLNLSTESIDFTIREGFLDIPGDASGAENFLEQEIVLSSLFGVSFSWSATIENISGGDWIQLSRTESNTLPLEMSTSVQVNAQPVGVYQANITFTYVHGAVTIPVTYTVLPEALEINSESLTFETIQTLAPPPQTLIFNHTGSESFEWDASIEYLDNNNWLNVNLASGVGSSAEIEVSPIGWNIIESLRAYIVFRYVQNEVSSRFYIPVNYDIAVSELSASPQALNFLVQNNSSLNDEVEIEISNSVSLFRNWTANADIDWISMDRVTGDTADNSVLTVSLNENIANLRGGEGYGEILISSTTGTTTTQFSIPVSIEVNTPIVQFVSPHVQEMNSSTEVILRGTGFSNISEERVFFGETPATSVNVISNTELRAVHPVLPTGNYPVYIENLSEGVELSRASLDFVPPTILIADEIISQEEGFSNPQYDAARRSILAIENENGRLFEKNHEYNSLRFSAGFSRSIGLSEGYRVVDFSLAPSGEFIALLGNHSEPTVNSILTLYKATDLSFYKNIELSSIYSHIQYSNNGQVLLISDSRQDQYDVLNDSIQPLVFSSSMVLSDSVLARSHDGSRILMANSGNTLPNAFAYYDASDNLVNPGFNSNSTNRFVSLDRSGGVSTLDNLVYDHAFALLGSVAYPNTNPVPPLVVVSPDGNRLYTYPLGGSATEIDIYDLTQTDGSGGFVNVGSIPVSLDPLDLDTEMSISYDGKLIFITNGNSLYVQPVP